MKRILFLLFIAISVSKVVIGQTILNGDFESWNTISYSDISEPWTSSNYNSMVQSGKMTVTKIPGKTGSGLRIQADNLSKNNFISDAQLIIPYAQIPCGLSGYYRSSLEKNDTAWVEVAFLKDGKFATMQKFPITGRTEKFTSFLFPIHLLIIPDTVIIYVYVNSNNHYNDVCSDHNNWIELDQLSFTGQGITQQIPGGDFETMHSITIDIPAGWEIKTDQAYGFLKKSFDHYSGSNSVCMTGLLTLQNGNGSTYRQPKDTLTGYYKYVNSNVDSSGSVFVSLQKNGNSLWHKKQYFSNSPTWKYFEIPIGAQNISTPDTILIQMGISNDGKTDFLIDGLQLKSGRQTFSENYQNPVKQVLKE